MPDSDRALHDRVKRGAEMIGESAKAFAARWSRQIPERISVIDGPDDATAIIRAEGGMARAYELHLKHPLNYPNQTGWANTPYRPFLRQGIDAAIDDAVEEVAEVIADWGEEYGFRRIT